MQRRRRRAWWAAVAWCVSAPATGAIAPQSDAPGARSEPAPSNQRPAPRDEQAPLPRVLRCVFEDRTRMVLVEGGGGLWLAFNPETCAVYKAWRGGVDFRGKVWDFSQDNSRATGSVLLQAPSEILRLPDDQPLPAAWTSRGVRHVGGGPDDTLGARWAFEESGAALESPAFDLRGWQRVFIAFDELSRRGPIRVEFSRDAGATWDAQWFLSCTHVSSDDEWQWNFKRVVESGERTRVRFVQEDAAFRKQVRGVRVFGDRPAWHALSGCEDSPGHSPIAARWRGYEIGAADGWPTLMYDLVLPDGATASVRHEIRMEARPSADVISERIVVEGLRDDALVLLALAGPTPPTRRVVTSASGAPAFEPSGAAGAGRPGAAVWFAGRPGHNGAAITTVREAEP